MLVRRGQFENTSGISPIKLGGPVSYGSYAVSKRMGKMDQILNFNGKRVLDLGCGNGCYTEEIARRAEYVCGIALHMPHLQVFREAIPLCQRTCRSASFSQD